MITFVQKAELRKKHDVTFEEVEEAAKSVNAVHERVTRMSPEDLEVVMKGEDQARYFHMAAIWFFVYAAARQGMKEFEITDRLLALTAGDR